MPFLAMAVMFAEAMPPPPEPSEDADAFPLLVEAVVKVNGSEDA